VEVLARRTDANLLAAGNGFATAEGRTGEETHHGLPAVAAVQGHVEAEGIAAFGF
jgi:hypothetical protein